MSHQLLKLMQHVIIYFQAFVFLDVFWEMVIYTEEVISESWNHKELLEHGVHVTNASKIPESHVFLLFF